MTQWMVADLGCLECGGTLTVRGIYADEATALSNAEPACRSQPLPEGDPRGRWEQVPQPWEPRSRSGRYQREGSEGRRGWVSETGEYEVHVLPMMPDPVDPDTPSGPATV